MISLGYQADDGMFVTETAQCSVCGVVAMWACNTGGVDMYRYNLITNSDTQTYDVHWPAGNQTPLPY